MYIPSIYHVYVFFLLQALIHQRDSRKKEKPPFRDSFLLCIYRVLLLTLSAFNPVLLFISSAIIALLCFLALAKAISKAQVYNTAIPFIMNGNINILVPAVTAPLLQAKKIAEVY